MVWKSWEHVGGVAAASSFTYSVGGTTNADGTPTHSDCPPHVLACDREACATAVRASVVRPDGAISITLLLAPHSANTSASTPSFSWPGWYVSTKRVYSYMARAVSHSTKRLSL